MHGILKRVSNFFSLPPESVAGVFRMELIGAEELYLEHHNGILSYSDTEVSLHGGEKILNIRGQNLTLSAMTEAEVVLRGTITEIVLEDSQEVAR